jgi:hypothetical protein
MPRFGAATVLELLTKVAAGVGVGEGAMVFGDAGRTLVIDDVGSED